MNSARIVALRFVGLASHRRCAVPAGPFHMQQDAGDPAGPTRGAAAGVVAGAVGERGDELIEAAVAQGQRAADRDHDERERRQRPKPMLPQPRGTAQVHSTQTTTIATPASQPGTADAGVAQHGKMRPR